MFVQCLGNSHDNFQLHRFAKSENIAKSFRGGGTFLTHTVHYMVSERRRYQRMFIYRLNNFYIDNLHR